MLQVINVPQDIPYATGACHHRSAGHPLCYWCMLSQFSMTILVLLVLAIIVQQDIPCATNARFHSSAGHPYATGASLFSRTSRVLLTLAITVRRTFLLSMSFSLVSRTELTMGTLYLPVFLTCMSIWHCREALGIVRPALVLLAVSILLPP